MNTSEKQAARYVFLDTTVREAAIFYGQREVDPEQWLLQYDKVNNVNKWGDKFHLTSVIFYVGGTTKVWYENREEIIRS